MVQRSSILSEAYYNTVISLIRYIGESNPCTVHALKTVLTTELARWLHKPNDKQPTLSLSDDVNAHPIQILPPAEGTRYLGIYLTTDHNTKPMERHLWAKTVLYTQAFQ